jgi:hypothetical protein
MERVIMVPNEPRYERHPIIGLTCPECGSSLKYLWYFAYECPSCNLLWEFVAGKEVAVYVKGHFGCIPYSVWLNPSRRF